jgi:hypothetical protein
MKLTGYLKKTFTITAIVLIPTLFYSCQKEEAAGEQYTVTGSGTAAQVIPPNSSTASATLTGTYNTGNRRLEYDIKWTALTNTATAVHLHGPALAGVNADIMLTLNITSADINGSATGSVTLTASQGAALLEGKMYFDIHTLSLPEGEVRGQVSAVKN